MANFNTYIDKIDVDFWRELCQREGKLRQYPKGAYFLRAGETAKYLGFIETGFFNYSVVDSSGIEHITGFALCNTLAGDFYSMIRREAALNSLKASVNSTAWVIDAGKVRQCLDAHPEFRCYFAEELFRMAHERYINLYRKSSKERYIEILNRCPDILQQITLKEMASYLNITPTHLSRIRKEMRLGK